MLSEITVEISGDDLESSIQAAFASMQDDLEAVLVEEGAMIIERSKEIVPVDEGVLRASGGFYGIDRSDFEVSVRIGYGGAASAYAWVQHETPPSIFSHDEGRSWKYLELPVMEAISTMPGRLASSLAGRLTARFSGTGGGGSGATFGGE